MPTERNAPGVPSSTGPKSGERVTQLRNYSPHRRHLSPSNSRLSGVSLMSSSPSEKPLAALDVPNPLPPATGKPLSTSYEESLLPQVKYPRPGFRADDVIHRPDDFEIVRDPEPAVRGLTHITRLHIEHVQRPLLEWAQTDARGWWVDIELIHEKMRRWKYRRWLNERTNSYWQFDIQNHWIRGRYAGPIGSEVLE